MEACKVQAEDNPRIITFEAPQRTYWITFNEQIDETYIQLLQYEGHPGYGSFRNSLWFTKNCKVYTLRTMDDRHVLNAIELIKRHWRRTTLYYILKALDRDDTRPFAERIKAGEAVKDNELPPDVKEILNARWTRFHRDNPRGTYQDLLLEAAYREIRMDLRVVMNPQMKKAGKTTPVDRTGLCLGIWKDVA